MLYTYIFMSCEQIIYRRVHIEIQLKICYMKKAFTSARISISRVLISRTSIVAMFTFILKSAIVQTKRGREVQFRLSFAKDKFRARNIAGSVANEFHAVVIIKYRQQVVAQKWLYRETGHWKCRSRVYHIKAIRNSSRYCVFDSSERRLTCKILSEMLNQVCSLSQVRSLRYDSNE